ncbi:sulfotransferase family protein [Streptomyces phaeochromogenes]
MSLQVIGAGLARTGTTSLKLALTQLLQRPTYHWREMVGQPGHVAAWHAAVHGRPPAWSELLEPYGAAVSVPASAFWQELADTSPEALVLLSTRDDPEQWWESLNDTLLTRFRAPAPGGSPMALVSEMATDLWQSRIGAGDMNDKKAMIAAYERHNEAVRTHAAPERLLEWRPSDGWAPIAAALDMPVPDIPFPRENTRAQFRAQTA